MVVEEVEMPAICQIRLRGAVKRIADSEREKQLELTGERKSEYVGVPVLPVCLCVKEDVTRKGT